MWIATIYIAIKKYINESLFGGTKGTARTGGLEHEKG
jgi:hypothetical protein